MEVVLLIKNIISHDQIERSTLHGQTVQRGFSTLRWTMSIYRLGSIN
jgi:hypothetical protein